MLILLFILMFGVAIVFSMLGLGGGVLYTPIQVWAGTGFHEAVATTLFLICVTSLSASLVFRKANKIDWPLVLVLETSTVIGGFLGGRWSGDFTGETLSMCFAAVVAGAACLMIRPLKPRAGHEPKTGLFWWERRLDDQAYSVNLALALPISFLAGLICGLVGVGGGIIKIPMMVLLFGVPMDIAVGSSALMIGITAAGGFSGHVFSGHWDWRTSLVLGIAVFAGGQIGSRIAVGLEKAKLKRRYGWFLLAIAALMLLQALAK